MRGGKGGRRKFKDNWLILWDYDIPYISFIFPGLDREPMRGAGVYFVLYYVDFFYLPGSIPHFEIVWVCFFFLLVVILYTGFFIWVCLSVGYHT